MSSQVENPETIDCCAPQGILLQHFVTFLSLPCLLSHPIGTKESTVTKCSLGRKSLIYGPLVFDEGGNTCEMAVHDAIVSKGTPAQEEILELLKHVNALYAINE